MAKKELPRITVNMLPNGYSLEFDGMERKEGFLYLNPKELLEGFMLHIGLNKLGILNTETMEGFIKAAAEWNSIEKCIEEISRLKAANNALRKRVHGLARKVIEERDLMLGLREVVKGNDKKKTVLLQKSGTKKPLTLRDLGITSDFIIEMEDTDNEDEEDIA